jgi:4-coumarate--CoA ligase
LAGLGLERVLVLDSRAGRWGWRSLEGGRSWRPRVDELERGRGKRLTWERVTDEKQLEESVICLLYSSGTTGVPKGKLGVSLVKCRANFTQLS